MYALHSTVLKTAGTLELVSITMPTDNLSAIKKMFYVHFLPFSMSIQRGREFSSAIRSTDGRTLLTNSIFLGLQSFGSFFSTTCVNGHFIKNANFLKKRVDVHFMAEQARSNLVTSTVVHGFPFVQFPS